MPVKIEPDDMQDAMHMVQAVLHSVDPAIAVRNHVRRDGTWLVIDEHSFDLSSVDRLVLIALGKAAAPMACAIGELAGDWLTSGVVVTKYGHVGSMLEQLRRYPLTIHEAGHPVPDENSAIGGAYVMTAISECTANTLVLACISGGASALVVAPIPGLRLQTMQAINEALLRSGADIREMNLVRSRLDQLKAGGLAQRSLPAQVVGLILSDVTGDPLDVIASGLTNSPEATNVLVANNAQACQAALHHAREMGYDTRVVTTELRGEARDRAVDIVYDICAAESGTCLIYGGETTVTIQGDGKGGRNQELALAAAIALDARNAAGIRIIAFGTDGTDGPTDAAGAIADCGTCSRAAALGLSATDHLARNDSYRFFSALGGLLLTGPTGTNVADVIIAFKEPMQV